jgi:hypothetical protein
MAGLEVTSSGIPEHGAHGAGPRAAAVRDAHLAPEPLLIRFRAPNRHLEPIVAEAQVLDIDAESTFNYFEAARGYLGKHGKPVAFYSDKAAVFRSNQPEPQGGDGVTQFGRALSELNIGIICANSAPAKGRVERANLTLQDRLVKELRLRSISTVEAANAFAPEFMADYNARFGKAPHNPHDAHRPLQPGEVLDDIFTWQETRKLSRSLTFNYQRQLYVVAETHETRRLAGRRLTVVELADGTVQARHAGSLRCARSERGACCRSE